jgi:hypothetical protein
VATEIDELIIARLKADATLSALGGRVVGDEAGAGTALPYAVVSLPGQAPTFESGAATSGGPAGLDEAELQVSVYAGSRAQAKALLALAEASLHGGSYGDGCLYLRRSNRLVELDPGKAASGADVWRGLATFRAILELE